MTKERLKVMTILDIMFIIAFGYSTIASWGVYLSLIHILYDFYIGYKSYYKNCPKNY